MAISSVDASTNAATKRSINGQVGLVVLTGIMALVSCWDAPFPAELKLQHIPTVVILLLMTWSTFACRFSMASFVCVAVFLWLHIVGARWIYSFVPYDDWSQSVSGSSLSQRFDWRRNHYDRLVHFASGILIAVPAAECLQRWGGMRPLGAAIVSIAIVVAIGAVYEILEWQIATFFAPAVAEAYNGQQGDVWDPQKDMALAWFGATISAGLLFRYRFESAAGGSVVDSVTD
ncbi:DUF2238 domain-containing protein [Rubripirellula lacrimiformis]|uniref:DUF2238 domain-containing protein n=1 Tax=Rubripirellula lacrimiformis TaxID=1930273 RepID=UPI001FECE4DE|nr:DUF2238 domain-containing protein [Rubripirellula lacrimiformis]